MDVNLGLDQDLINSVKAITEASCACKDDMKKEELVGGQKKLDKNGNGKLDADDFKKLRKEEEELDEEQLDELSKKTLGSYVKKAGEDKAAAHVMASHSDKGSYNKNEFIKRAVTRTKGIDKALGKLTKEQVEEIEALAAKHGLGE